MKGTYRYKGRRLRSTQTYPVVQHAHPGFQDKALIHHGDPWTLELVRLKESPPTPAAIARYVIFISCNPYFCEILREILTVSARLDVGLRAGAHSLTPCMTA